jgi:hypothetical protein
VGSAEEVGNSAADENECYHASAAIPAIAAVDGFVDVLVLMTELGAVAVDSWLEMGIEEDEKAVLDGGIDDEVVEKYDNEAVVVTVDDAVVLDFIDDVAVTPIVVSTDGVPSNY